MRVWSFVRNNPIPLFVLLGLLAGVAAAFVFKEGEWGHDIWFATLVAGGLPIVYGTNRIKAITDLLAEAGRRNSAQIKALVEVVEKFKL